MIGFNLSQDSNPNNQVALQRLSRALRFSQEQFSLLLICCNSTRKQLEMLSVLREYSPVEIEDIVIPPSAQTLYSAVEAAIGHRKPEAVMVRGLECVTSLNQLIISTNLMRDELRKQFQFPLMLCVNEDILRKLIWLAPDLKDWAACTIRFDFPNNSMIEHQALSA